MSLTESFDYPAFKAEFKRKKRKLGAHWWYGRFWAQDVVDALGQSAAEFTSLPWNARQLSSIRIDRDLALDSVEALDEAEEMELTRAYLRESGQDVFIQELLGEVFSELAAEAAMRESELDALRAVRDEWIEMLVVPAAV